MSGRRQRAGQHPPPQSGPCGGRADGAHSTEKAARHGKPGWVPAAHGRSTAEAQACMGSRGFAQTQPKPLCDYEDCQSQKDDLESQGYVNEHGET